MADPCIVCLGDLAATETSPPDENGEITNVKLEDSSSLQHELPQQDPGVTTLIRTRRESKCSAHLLPSLGSRLPTVGEESQVIAHLLPCGHNLHDECLKPWVERANSCPICRTNFNVVELKHSINGPSFSSYIVEDKQQEAEIDPSMLIDDDLFDEWLYDEACFFCSEWSEDDVFLVCDGCENYWHTYCAGLPEVPAGPWYCRDCVETGGGAQITNGSRRRARASTAQRTSARAPPRRQRGGRGRVRGQSPGPPSAWAQVWQSVWDSLNLDLDFPWDDEVDNTTHRTEAQQLEIAEWHRRFQVAERQGGAARFRETASALLQRNAAPSPKPESQEELRAWNAFDKAKELQSDTPMPTGNGRNKRKSVTASPIEAVPEPERKLKRPKTRRNEALEKSHAEAGAPSRKLPSPAGGATRPRLHSLHTDINHPGPSFFQSLLKEVESAPATGELDEQQNSPLDQAPPTSPPCSHGMPSPRSSPSIPYHNSPRGRSISPPPLRLSRPSSPPPLTSRIEPIFPRRPVSPQSAAQSPHTRPTDPPIRAPRTNAASPGRAIISLSAKTEIQKLVTAALKPAYKKREINTEQYTEINRDVSRLLYDIAAETGDPAHGSDRERWRSIAAEEVEKSVSRLREVEVNSVA